MYYFGFAVGLPIEHRESLADERGQVKPMVQFIHCPRHGTQCTKCWEVLDNDDDVKNIHLTNECPGLPKELRNAPDAAGIRRCPFCQMPIQRSIGCDDMTCASCKKHFNWASAPKLEPVPGTASTTISSSSSSSTVAAATTRPITQGFSFPSPPPPLHMAVSSMPDLLALSRCNYCGFLNTEIGRAHV